MTASLACVCRPPLGATPASASSAQGASAHGPADISARTPQRCGPAPPLHLIATFDDPTTEDTTLEPGRSPAPRGEASLSHSGGVRFSSGVDPRYTYPGPHAAMGPCQGRSRLRARQPWCPSPARPTARGQPVNDSSYEFHTAPGSRFHCGNNHNVTRGVARALISVLALIRTTPFFIHPPHHKFSSRLLKHLHHSTPLPTPPAALSSALEGKATRTCGPKPSHFRSSLFAVFDTPPACPTRRAKKCGYFASAQ